MYHKPRLPHESHPSPPSLQPCEGDYTLGSNVNTKTNRGAVRIQSVLVRPTPEKAEIPKPLHPPSAIPSDRPATTTTTMLGAAAALHPYNNNNNRDASHPELVYMTSEEELEEELPHPYRLTDRYHHTRESNLQGEPTMKRNSHPHSGPPQNRNEHREGLPVKEEKSLDEKLTVLNRRREIFDTYGRRLSQQNKENVKERTPKKWKEGSVAFTVETHHTHHHTISDTNKKENVSNYKKTSLFQSSYRILSEIETNQLKTGDSSHYSIEYPFQFWLTPPKTNKTIQPPNQNDIKYANIVELTEKIGEIKRKTPKQIKENVLYYFSVPTVHYTYSYDKHKNSTLGCEEGLTSEELKSWLSSVEKE
ncbi:hypothetical protein AGDE_16932 [Angomonas deanei]|nr:hypothetical protein AGDE_16932 [Angomonas deanei]|eukprot:EPY15870.1 hypothetical protein AGDE_16932 [Angomonas deanei]